MKIRVLLNGKPVYLQGFGRNEDFHILGKGLNHSLNIRDHDLLRWINANSYRTTHYPYSEELMQLSEAHGFLLIGEAPDGPLVGRLRMQFHASILREFNSLWQSLQSRGRKVPTDRNGSGF